MIDIHDRLERAYEEGYDPDPGPPAGCDCGTDALGRRYPCDLHELTRCEQCDGVDSDDKVTACGEVMHVRCFLRLLEGGDIALDDLTAGRELVEAPLKGAAE